MSRKSYFLIALILISLAALVLAIIWPQSIGKPTYTYADIYTCNTGTYSIVINHDYECDITLLKGNEIKSNVQDGINWYKDEIISITLHGDIKTIGKSAFEGFSRIESVDIPYGVEKISYKAFSGCRNLDSISLPDSVTTLGDSVFYGCRYLEEVSLSNNLKEIPEEAFCDCPNIKSIEIPEGVESIGYQAFGFCESLRYVSLPNSLKYMDEEVFVSCSKLQYTELDNLCYLGNDDNPFVALMKADNMECSEYYIHSGTRIIYNYAFMVGHSEQDFLRKAHEIDLDIGIILMSTAAKHIYIPQGVVSIGRFAFYGCRNLTDITIPDTVEQIGDLAFANCGSLYSITIPSSVKKIGREPLSVCYRLAEVVNLSDVKIVADETNYFIPRDIYTNLDDYHTRLSFDDNGFVYYLYDDNKALIGYEGDATDITIPNDVTKIDPGAFAGCQKLNSITVPNSVKEMGIYAFAGCTSLKTVSLSDNINNIPEYAFYKCNSLNSVIVPNNIEYIESNAFAYCNNIEYNKLNDKYYLSSKDNNYAVLVNPRGYLYTIEIEPNTKIIYNNAFNSNGSAIMGGKNLVIPDGVTQIGVRAFYYCTSLTTINIPHSVKKIGECAFPIIGNSTIYYDGTMEEFKAIKPTNMGAKFTVSCNDGNLNL